jgi:hypothetical protein
MGLAILSGRDMDMRTFLAGLVVTNARSALTNCRPATSRGNFIAPAV